MSMAKMMGEREGQTDRKRAWQSGSRQSPDDHGRPSTPSKGFRRGTMSTSYLSLSEDNIVRRFCRESLSLSSRGSYITSSTEKPTECKKRKRVRSFLRNVCKAVRRSLLCCCLSDVDVVESFVPPADLEPEPDPGPSSPDPDHSGVKPNNGRTDRKREWQSGSRQSPDDHGRPSTPSKGFRRAGIMSTSYLSLSEDNTVRRFCRESLSLSSRGSYIVDWRWSGDRSDSRNEQGSWSDEEWMCHPLPGQVPVEPTETSNGLMEASPVNTSSTDSFETLYNVGEMIGSGTFGRVFKGTRKFDGKKVAIKQMHKIDNDRYLDIPGHPEPLVTEVALLLMMRHEPISPYVVRLYDWFEHPRTFVLIMEFPDPCESLLDFIIRHSCQLDETTARVILRQAALAVQHCIEHGVFHNDVHAENFLVKTNTLELKLIDFGCGQLLSGDGYETKIYRGLPSYCPPEVFTESRFHAVPANVWALGVLLYLMVNGRSPFGNRTEITQAKVTFQNSNLSKGDNTCCPWWRA